MSKKEKEVKQEEVAEKEEAVEVVEEAQTNPQEKELAEVKEALLRTAAEYDNYRKRTAKERMELTADVTAKTAGEFLPVIDNLERALQSECTDENYKKGIAMIYDSLVETLKKLGVEEIEAVDFNPSFHQAVQQVESDELESGKISAVFQKGYKLGDKVLRFAMVAVVS